MVENSEHLMARCNGEMSSGIGLVGFRSSFCRNGERVVASPGNQKGVRSDRLVLEMEKG